MMEKNDVDMSSSSRGSGNNLPQSSSQAQAQGSAQNNVKCSPHTSPLPSQPPPPPLPLFFPMNSAHVDASLGAAAAFLFILQVISLIVLLAAPKPSSSSPYVSSGLGPNLNIAMGGGMMMDPNLQAHNEFPGNSDFSLFFSGAMLLVYIGFLLPLVLYMYSLLHYKVILFFFGLVGVCLQFASFFESMFVPMRNYSSYINLTSVSMLSYHFTAVFITLGLTIKYLSPLQIIIMAILEMLFVICCKHLMSFLTVEDSTGVLSIHIFGSLFGLGVYYIFSFDSFFNIRRPDDFMTSDSRLYKSLTYWERMRLNQRQTFRNIYQAYYKSFKPNNDNIYADKRTHESFDDFQRRSRKGSVLSSASNNSHEYELINLPEVVGDNEEIGSSSNEVVNFDRKINNLWPDIESDLSNHSSGGSGGGSGGGFVGISDGNFPILMKYFDITHYFSIAILFIYFPNFNSMGLQISTANMTSSLYPSFNGAFVKPFLCLCSSLATSFALSILTNQSSDLRKIALTDCRSAIIAAGVSIGSISRLSLHPAIYILIGMISGCYTSININFLRKLSIFGPVIDNFFVKNNNYSGHAAGGVIGILTSIIASACNAEKFFPYQHDSVFGQLYVRKSNAENENQWLFQILGLALTATIAFLAGLLTAKICVFADNFVSRYIIIHKRSEHSILQLHHNISFNSLEENNGCAKEAESPKSDNNDSPTTPVAESTSSHRPNVQTFPFIDKYTANLVHESSTFKKLSSSHNNGLSLTAHNIGIMAKQASDGATQEKDEDDAKKMKKLSWPKWIFSKIHYVYSAPAIDTNPRFVSEDELELVKKLDNLLIEQTGVKNVLAFKNHQFTLFFAQYIIEEWNLNYFAYDHLKGVYQELKDNKKNVSKQDYVSYQEAYEDIFLKEIMRVDMFICKQLKEITYDLAFIREYWIKLDAAAKVKVQSDEEEKDRLEGEIRTIYETCTKLESFHKLNEFIIFKIVKKYEKLHEVSKKVKNIDFKEWKKHDSYSFFKEFFENRKLEIIERKREVINVYSSILRQTYAKLAEGELKFVKDYEYREGIRSALKTSIKLGFIVTSLFWIAVDMRNKGGVSIWVRPELYVFSCIASFLVFKTTWIFNTWIWSTFHINYASLLQLTTLEKPNHILLIDEASTLLVILLVCMILFFKSINPEASFFNPDFAYACPVFLLVSLAINEIYDAFKFRNSVVSRGLFDFETLKLSFSTPFVAVRFRENYGCDVLTSFTKIIIDSSYAACWLISGYIFNPTHEKEAQTISDFGSSYLQCITPSMTSYTTFVVLVPLSLRALQCLRNCRDHGFHPHILNFLKYASSMIVPIYGYYRPGKPDQIALVVLVSLYKWWWDVVMDWGLFSILPTSYDDIFKRKTGEYLFLRKNLIYRNPLYYYIAIVLDLLLRFLWVISLVPSLYGVFKIGPTLSLFMGSAELCRRSMWGVFRVEWEHLKFVDKHVIGYKLERHIK